MSSIVLDFRLNLLKGKYDHAIVRFVTALLDVVI